MEPGQKRQGYLPNSVLLLSFLANQMHLCPLHLAPKEPFSWSSCITWAQDTSPRYTESLPKSLPLKAAVLRWWSKLEISPKPMLTPCPASGWTLWAASLRIKWSSGVASSQREKGAALLLLSYPMRASRGRTYSAACPNPRGNRTRLLASTLATLGGIWRAETLVGFRKATADCSMEPTESMKSVWFTSLHWVVVSTTKQSESSSAIPAGN